MLGVLLACVVLLVASCGSPGPTTATGPSGIPGWGSSSPAAPAPEDTPSGSSSVASPSNAPSALKPVGAGELTHFRAQRGSRVIVDAASSGLARYNSSTRCEVANRPCYDAPYLDKVARIDLGAPPTVPGTQTTFITGHANRFHPDDPGRGVFSRLQQVRKGDTLVLTTTRGRFVYAVTEVLTVPFDKLTSTPAVVTVRPDTVVAISCVIPPDRLSYAGNYVVVGSLRSSSPS
ncbi:sortase family protein [Humibacillus xanthopallidus]|uniref:Sortase family protein n=1 Tax=Humibacillus xanthopallidus TaxID=412689 RepID=A0A543PWC1_9MICO|nr:sortase family protein [Humibacillus xanthopallidus]